MSVSNAAANSASARARTAEMTPIVLIPGLTCTVELFGPQIPALRTKGPIRVASTREGETMATDRQDHRLSTQRSLMVGRAT
ncbi:hypothetical protein QE389_000197 [Brevundimonas sp. SORGH_AS 993]|nr:hypothetical protein [Brevundimonas sp. SORGH_AS_0993]